MTQVDMSGFKSNVIFISAMVPGSETDKAIRALKEEMDRAAQFDAYLQQFSGEPTKEELISQHLSFKMFTGKIDQVWVDGELREPTDGES